MIRQLHKVVPADTSFKYVFSGMFEGGIGIALTPEAGGTMLLQYQISKNGAWRDWPSGTVSEYTEDVLISSVYAVQALSYGSDGVLEIAH